MKSSGWWLVENEEKRLAWFPAPYLELCEDEEEGDDEFDSEGGQRRLQVDEMTIKVKMYKLI